VGRGRQEVGTEGTHVKIDEEREAVGCSDMWGKIVVVEDLVSGIRLHSIYSSDLMHCVLLNFSAPWTIPLELVLISH
jgi:hypothetical protein